MAFLFLDCLIIFRTKLSCLQFTCSNLICQIAMDCVSVTACSKRAAAHEYMQTDTAMQKHCCDGQDKF